MGPKKAAAEAKVSALPAESPEKEVAEGTAAEVSEEQTKTLATRKPSTHPPTMEMVKEALKELDSRKGVSVQAIRAFIKEKHPTVDEMRVKFMVRKALVKGIELGTFVRPANSNTTGAQGRFRLAVRKPKDAKPPKKTKENADPNVGKSKAKEAGAEKTKPAKKKPAADGNKAKKTNKDTSASKVAPAKKPKAKKAAEEEPEPKAQKASKTSKSEGAESGKTAAKKGGKKGAQKAVEEGSEGAEAAAATAPKKGKKAAQKAQDGEKKVSDGGEEGGAAAPKASGRKGKKAAEK